MTPRPPVEPWWLASRGRGHRKPAARGTGARRGFGATWWGQAWVEALEQRAALDRNRLPRGRGYARSGSVSDLEIGPGEVRALVQGSRSRPYSVVVRVQPFTNEEWNRVLDAVAVQLGRTAALLDGELPPDLVDDVASAGLSLLPEAGEVLPECSCPDWADPCKHAAAVCYLVADELDTDPFALLRLRGRDRDQVLAGLRTRRAGGATPARATADSPDVAGVPARTAYARTLGPLPAVPLPPRRPGRPTVLEVEPPPESGVTGADLAALAADAITRAWQLVTGDRTDGLDLDVDADLARRAAAALGRGEAHPDVSALARRAGVPARELTRRALAWRAGGKGGLDASLEKWQPAAGELDDGRAALASAVGSDRIAVQRNRLTAGAVQLRLGRDGLWYRFHRDGTTWNLHGAAADPADLWRSTGGGIP